jgi:3-dehydroquinate synthase
MDAVEHRHGKQRVPLVTGIGESICVNDITREEVDKAVKEMVKMHENANANAN